ncbi:adenylate cyclase-like [Vanessa cardui]|uniref:adenylate cyclase-like n=1 Tax=Vanessa cardui TaxID=171605 RepID=UPI001F148B15|nr:adenylate cyclase-like [Vanessa cardui]
MKPKYICILLVLSLTVNTVFSQNEDELSLPPDHTELEGFIEGSGDGVVDEPVIVTTTEPTAPPKLESVEGMRILDEESVPKADSNNNSLPCPKPCVCNTEGDTDNFIVDCSGYGLTEFPSPIDSRTTTLKLHNNKLTEIPKTISELKSLKVLNANNNLIMELAPGSISELPQLVTLNLGNNRLIEYPKDLKNSLSLSKLEELDLGGNDMRTKLSSDNFSNFKALRKITLPSGSTDLALDLCETLKETLETVCTESCDTKPFDCPDAPQKIDEDLFDATLPGMIPLNTFEGNKEAVTETESSVTESTSTTIPLKPLETDSNLNENIPANEFSLRTAVINAPQEKIASLNAIPDSPKDASNATNVKVGATTADTKKTGGVDKSVIGMVVAGMIVVVAGITIKKNWSSIKKRFSSTPNRATERPGGNANGTTPEEVPLQNKSDKLPV